MAKIVILDEETSEVTRESNPDDEWDNDDIATSHHICGFKVVDDGYYHLEIPFEPSYDKTYFLLYVLYSTGDSFHHEEGHAEYIDLYETPELAEENKTLIEEDEKRVENLKGYVNTDYWSVVLKDNNGNEHKMNVSWRGYFERIEDICIKTVRREYQ